MTTTEAPINRSFFNDGPITNVDAEGDKGFAVVVEGWTCFVSRERYDGPPPLVGQRCEVETIQATVTVGMRVEGAWLFRLSDDQIRQERADWLAENDRKRRERLEANRYEYSQREAALPLWARLRMRRFHDAGGEKFERDGWGYELHICEYAAAMVAGDQEKMKEHEGQASGNTHDCAALLARLIREGRENEAAGVVPAGMAPLMRSADYS